MRPGRQAGGRAGEGGQLEKVFDWTVLPLLPAPACGEVLVDCTTHHNQAVAGAQRAGSKEGAYGDAERHADPAAHDKHCQLCSHNKQAGLPAEGVCESLHCRPDQFGKASGKQALRQPHNL